MNLYDIERAIENHEHVIESRYGGSYTEDGWYAWLDAKPQSVTGLGNVKVVEEFGGEGMGDQRYLVFEVTAADGSVRFFKKEGYYSSYDGTDWDGDFSEVRPVEKTVTVYERVS